MSHELRHAEIVSEAKLLDLFFLAEGEFDGGRGCLAFAVTRPKVVDRDATIYGFKHRGLLHFTTWPKKSLIKCPPICQTTGANQCACFASCRRQMGGHTFEGASMDTDDFKKFFENGMASNFNPSMPAIDLTIPRRAGDCPAAPVCESVGNLKRSCLHGSPAGGSGPGLDVCIASLILLVSRAVGQWPEEMIEEVEEKRRIGFFGQNRRAAGHQSETDEA